MRRIKTKTELSPVEFEDRELRNRLRLQIMGLGGVSAASKKTAISYWRLSRILNGWVIPNGEEIRRIAAHLRSAV